MADDRDYRSYTLRRRNKKGRVSRVNKNIKNSESKIRPDHAKEKRTVPNSPIEAVRQAAEKRRREKKLIYYKIWFIRTAIICSIVFLAYQIVDLKLTYGDEYTRRAILQLINSGSESDMTINPNRGAIMDRNRQPLAISSTVYNVFLDVKMLLERASTDRTEGDNPENTIDDTFKAINEVLGVSLDQLYSYVAKNDNGEYIYGNHQYVVFARQVKNSDARRLMDLRTEYLNRGGKVLRDVYIEAQSERNYIYGTLASQVIGFIRGDAIWGLERQYNTVLTGTPGRIFQTYAVGGVTTDRVDAVEGSTLITTIDLQLQQFVEGICQKYAQEHNASNASVIIMNPNTGEIHAMAESTGFDLNDPMNLELLTNSSMAAELESLDQSELLNRMNGIWINFNTTSTFEPGSIFKPITIAAALEEGIITRNQLFYCGGVKQVANIPIRCHKRSGHGYQTLDEALMNSCNIAVMDMAEWLGRADFYKYQRDFGYGEKTGIDLPAEADAAALQHSLSGFNPVELATASFGQRFKCTPIQAITSFAAVINGGILYQPYVVSQIADNNGNIVYEKSPTVIRKVITEETSNYLRESMERVISLEGTGRRAIIDGYSIGGKTGTGEQTVRTEENDEVIHSVSFIGYLPVEDPKYLVLALIDLIPPEYYKDGETSAGPMIKEVFQYLIDNKGIQPAITDESSIPKDRTIVDDYIGKTVLEAAQMINSSDLKFEFIGASGTIISAQSPEAGKIVPKGTTIWLSITTEGDYELKAVPSLIGLDPETAEELILSEGFIPVIEYDDPEPTPNVNNANNSNNENDEISLPEEPDVLPNLVYSQSPKSGIMVIEGMEIKINVR